MADAILTDREFVELVTTHQLRAVADNRRMGFDAYQSNAKWLLASILAINSAGLIAAFNTDGGWWALAGATAFFAGMIASLLIGWHGQFRLRRSLDHLKDYELYLLEAQRTGTLNEDVGNDLISRLKTEGRDLARALWLIAVLCFSGGVVGLAADKAPTFSDRSAMTQTASE